jgi:hypothetical protein
MIMPEVTTERDDSARETSSSKLPIITFSTFVVSLNAAVLAHLGVIDEPGTGRRTKNLPLAKQTIDVLAMLEEKTRGNLSQEEATMLKSVLYDLRIIYVRELG